MDIVFETHATSFDNEAGRASGWQDVDLSPAGVTQATQLGARYAGVELAAVYTSDLRRALRTAALAFGGEPAPIADPRLRECDYGVMTGEPTAAIDAEREARIDAPFPGGESYAGVVARVGSWLAEASALAPGGLVLVIGHRATWYALEHLLQGRPLREVIVQPWRWQPGWRYRLRGAAPGEPDGRRQPRP